MLAAAKQGFFASLNEIFTVGAIVAAAGVVLALLLVQHKDLLHGAVLVNATADAA
ncbi:MAG: hypothetical protein ABI352_04505 [Candidatus Dormibacter sp.]